MCGDEWIRQHCVATVCMSGTVHDRTLTNLLSKSRRSRKGAQVLRNARTLRNGDRSRGVAIRTPYGERIVQGKLGGSSGQGIRNGIPDHSRRRVGAQKVHRISGGTASGNRNGVDIHLLNPVCIATGNRQGQRTCGNPQRLVQGGTALKDDQLGGIHRPRCIREVGSVECKSGQSG